MTVGVSGYLTSQYVISDDAAVFISLFFIAPMLGDVKIIKNMALRAPAVDMDL